MKTLLLLYTALLFTASACAPSGPRAPEIAYGQELCESCGMLIDSPQYAAASVLKDGTAHKFDDLGEMIIYHLDHPDQNVAAYFVHDYGTQAWIRAEAAAFVKVDPQHSPMASGLVAFEKKADAQAYAAGHSGEVLTFDEMRLYVHEVLHS